MKNWVTIQGDNTFQPDRVTRGVITGFFTRILDMPNECGVRVTHQLKRLVWEPISVGVPLDCIKATFRKISAQMRMVLHGVSDAFEVSPTTAEVLHVGCDAVSAPVSLLDATERRVRSL